MPLPEPGLLRGLPLGSVLNSTYRIERLLGEGGMGAVFEARHLRLNRRVALKILLVGDDGWDAAAVERLRAEALIVAQLDHPHIMQVSDVDETEHGVPYLVMEYLQGMTLGERLARDRVLPIVEAVRIASQIAAALAQVHARGIVHCDMKPENVFLARAEDKDDFVKVFDFGVSQAAGVASPNAGIVAGTPRYMAPEQWRGACDLDGRTDQFALAELFYEMLSGQPVLRREQSLRIPIGQRGEPPPLSERAPWISSVFDPVLRRAMSIEREDRFPSISQFAWALGNAGMKCGIGLAN
jgi:serine/threonine-protein kinase